MYIVPRHKFDDEAITHLRMADKQAILLVQMELLEWLQDTCWPVFPHVRDILIAHVNDMEDAIIEVLRIENDLMWKENVVGHLLCDAPDPLSERLKQELRRLIDESKESYEEDLVEWCNMALEK